MSNLCAFLLEDALRHNSQAMLAVNSMTTASPNGDNRLRQRTPF
jgi:hypothetical protein